MFDMKSDESLSLIQKQFFEFRWESNVKIAQHISKLEQLANKMKALGGEIPSSMFITRILSTLPPAFSHFHSAWDSTEATKRTLTNLTTRLMTEEFRLQKKENEPQETTVALMSNLKVQPDSSKKTNFLKKKKILSCFICGSKEHLKKNCPKKREQRRDCNKPGVRQAFVGNAGQGSSEDCWLIDSGASDHMTSRRSWFSEFRQFSVPTKIRIGNGEQLFALGQGEILIETYVGGAWIPGMLYDVLFVPDTKQNLFSVKVAAKRGVDFVISDRGRRCEFLRNGTVVATGAEVGKLYSISMRVLPSKAMCVANQLDTVQLWHERLGHQNKRHVQTFLYGKHHRLSFGERRYRATRPRELIHSDVCGPMNVQSLGKRRYYLVFRRFHWLSQGLFLTRKIGS